MWAIVFQNHVRTFSQAIYHLDLHLMVVCSTAGGNDEQRAREGNDGRVD
mgnify:CR=1 FL=1